MRIRYSYCENHPFKVLFFCIISDIHMESFALVLQGKGPRHDVLVQNVTMFDTCWNRVEVSSYILSLSKSFLKSVEHPEP